FWSLEKTGKANISKHQKVLRLPSIAKAEAKKKEAEEAANAKADMEQGIKKASKGKNVLETEDNDENVKKDVKENDDENVDAHQTDIEKYEEESDNVDQVFNKIQIMSFLNTPTRSKKKR
nr:hypothetical protein [Tanacetum cinerariifolium]